MNITIFAYKLNKLGGGSNISLDLMSRKLVERGNNIKVVTLRPNNNNIFVDREYEVIEPSRDVERQIYDLDLVPIIKEYLQSLNKWTDVYHVFNPYLAPLIGKHCSNFETPFVLRFNSLASVCTRGQPLNNECYKQCGAFQRFKHDDEQYPKRLLKIPEYLFTSKKLFNLVNNFDKIFALSPAVKEVITGMGATERKIVIIPNFYDPHLNEYNISNPYSNSKNTFDILFVGRLVQVKRPDILLEAISKVPEENVQVHIVGDGPMKEKLIKKTQELKIEDKINFCGYIENSEIPSYYSNADLFVHTQSGPYSFSRTVLEAIQFSVPVLTTDSGDVKKMVGDAAKTFISDSPDDLAEEISTTLASPDELAKLKNSCEKVIQEYHPDEIVADIEEEYENVMRSSVSM